MRHEQFEKFIVAIEAEGLLLVVDLAIMSLEITHARIHEVHDVHFWMVARRDKRAEGKVASVFHVRTIFCKQFFLVHPAYGAQNLRPIGSGRC
ncbi:hypothetical protein [Sulfuricella denitrificans]|uniref:hypothetical protein n=1 Tax=Sulfuricella denitrificans TaxID=649841 RepID=UPI0011D1EE70|nr:hypothetical protein [Sulfuricella denitrificans]